MTEAKTPDDGSVLLWNSVEGRQGIACIYKILKMALTSRQGKVISGLPNRMTKGSFYEACLTEEMKIRLLIPA